MFEQVIWFFDHVSLVILCIIAAASYSVADALSKIRQTPVVFAISGFAMVAHFIHLYQQAPDATFESLWQPLVRSVATGAITLGGLMPIVILAVMIWDTHYPPISRMFKAIKKYIKETRRRPEPEPIYESEPPPIPTPTPREMLTSQARDAQDEYHDTVGVLSTIVSSLDQDEAEEIEMLAKQKLLARLNDLMGGNDDH